MKSVSFVMLKAEKAWAWQTPQTLCWEESLVADAAAWRASQESYCYQLPGITLPFPVREWVEHQTTFAMLEEQKLALVQYLASLAHSMGIRAAIQFTSITSTKHRAHMQVSSSDHCERAILSTVSMFAKGREINEECLLCNVESWESLSLADTSDLVSGRALVADAAVWQASRNPIATSYLESRCLFRFENEPSNKTTFAMLEEQKFASCNILPVLLIQWAFVQQSSSHQSPVPNIEQTCRCQAVTTVRQSHSLHSFHFCKGSADQWRVSPLQCWKLRKLELGRHLRPCVGKSFGCWCCCVTGFQESYCYQLPGIALPFPGREWAEHQTAFATLGRTKSCPRSISCQCC